MNSIKGIVDKKFILAGQTVNSAYYCDFLWRLCEMFEDFALNFDDKGTGCFITTHRLTLPFFTREFFTKNNMIVVPHQPNTPYLAPPPPRDLSL
jgi:hypothetical protein